jgi:uncharacterized iron-regulated membrane protein
MSFRKALFWTHLAAGVVASLVVIMMSVTGVVLTYERQIKEWADRSLYDIAEDGAKRLTVDELLAAVREQDPDMRISTIAVHSRPDTPPMATQGRSGRNYLDPTSGGILGAGNTGYREFFSTFMGWHRWFDLTGDPRSTGRAVTGAANLLFLFLIVSGLYLWLPPLWRRAMFRQRLFFNDRVKTSKARDYNWHHVFGFWSLIPLFLIVLSALTISYTWARNSVYTISGEDAPSRSGSSPPVRLPQLPDGVATKSLQELFDIAAAESSQWRRIDVQVPDEWATTVNISIDEGSGGEPTKKQTLTFDRISGSIVKRESFNDRTPARKVLGYFRWVHTGEAHGLVGQTIAGLVSAFAVLMAWTGLALSYRRLIQPVIRQRRLEKARKFHPGT